MTSTMFTEEFSSSNHKSPCSGHEFTTAGTTASLSSFKPTPCTPSLLKPASTNQETPKLQISTGSSHPSTPSCLNSMQLSVSTPISVNAASKNTATPKSENHRQSNNATPCLLGWVRSNEATPNLLSPSPLNTLTPSPMSSTTTTPSRICRICHDGDRKEKLYSPCHCSGTMALVHQNCLERWLSTSEGSRCEVCNYSFEYTRQPQPLRKWFQSPSHPRDIKTLIGDGICLALLTPLATLSCYLCYIGIVHYMNWNCRLEVAGLVVLCCCLATVYMVWVVITARYHIRVWREWKTTHQSVKLLRLTKYQAAVPDEHTSENQNNDELQHFGFSDEDLTVEIEDNSLSSKVCRTDPESESILPCDCATQRTVINGVETVEVIPRMTVSVITFV